MEGNFYTIFVLKCYFVKTRKELSGLVLATVIQIPCVDQINMMLNNLKVTFFLCLNLYQDFISVS